MGLGAVASDHNSLRACAVGRITRYAAICLAKRGQPVFLSMGDVALAEYRYLTKAVFAKPACLTAPGGGSSR